MYVKLLTVVNNPMSDTDWEACTNNRDAFGKVIDAIPAAIDSLNTPADDYIPDCVTYDSALSNDITKSWLNNVQSIPVTFIMTSDDAIAWKSVKLSDNKLDTMVKALTYTIQNQGIPSGFFGSSWDGNGGFEGLGFSMCDFLPEWMCSIKVPNWIWLIAAGASGAAFVSSSPQNKLAKVVYGGLTAGCIFKYATSKE